MTRLDLLSISLGGTKKELGKSLKLLCHSSPSARLSDGLRAATQCDLAPMCTAQKITDGIALINYEHTRVLQRHPQLSIHLGGTIEAYCHCAASCYSATASHGCAASYRVPSAHLSDGFSAAVLPAAALATAALNVSSWLWTCSSFEKAHQFEALDPSKDCLNFSVAARSSHIQASLLNAH
jgi:hypothetical protein